MGLNDYEIGGKPGQHDCPVIKEIIQDKGN
jgi:hypothetical protein